VNHFTDEQWVDYARGLSSPEATGAEMDRHLREGCENCHTLFALWRAVAEVATRESRYQAPADAVRAAEVAFAGWSRLQLLRRRARPARLTFDSLWEPLAAGVRSQSVSPRRVVQRAGRWIIDLRLEPEPGKRLSLTGQVHKSGEDPGAQTGMEVSLVSNDKLVTQTSTNAFGEFEFHCDPAQEMHIYIGVPGRRPIAVKLPDSDDAAGPVGRL
jgi:hypothetical protein